VDERLEDYLAAQCLEQAKPAERRVLLDRVAASATRPGAGRLLAALAAKSIGRQTEAQQAFDAWNSQQRDRRVADWGRGVFDGQRPGWPAGVPTNAEWRVLAEWLALDRR
jgi:hypothetical protein